MRDQKIVSAENSDLFDVLAQVAYALAPLTRSERAASVKPIYHNSIPDAVADLGPASEIHAAFLGFQKALYLLEAVVPLRR